MYGATRPCLFSRLITWVVSGDVQKIARVLTVLADNARGGARLVAVVVEVDDGVVAAAVLVVVRHPGSKPSGAAALAALSGAASGARLVGGEAGGRTE